MDGMDGPSEVVVFRRKVGGQGKEHRRGSVDTVDSTEGLYQMLGDCSRT